MAETPSSEIGFVGAGAIGEPVIRRISSQGQPVLVHDADAARMERLASLPNVSLAHSIEELEPASLVLCMLPNSEIVAEVVAGPTGLMGHLRQGSLIVDMGSSDPRCTIRLSRRAASAGLGLVDAPVSGGVAGALTGGLTAMFGGDALQLDRCRPVLELVASTIVHVGAVGSGHAMKSLNNLLSAVGLAAATEVIEIGRNFGLDPELMLTVLNQSTGRNHATETKIKQFVLSGEFSSGFALRLMLKDVATAMTLAKDAGLETPLGEACLALWRKAADELPPDADQTRIGLMPVSTGR